MCGKIEALAYHAKVLRALRRNHPVTALVQGMPGHTVAQHVGIDGLLMSSSMFRQRSGGLANPRTQDDAHLTGSNIQIDAAARAITEKLMDSAHTPPGVVPVAVLRSVPVMVSYPQSLSLPFISLSSSRPSPRRCPPVLSLPLESPSQRCFSMIDWTCDARYQMAAAIRRGTGAKKRRLAALTRDERQLQREGIAETSDVVLKHRNRLVAVRWDDHAHRLAGETILRKIVARGFRANRRLHYSRHSAEPAH